MSELRNPAVPWTGDCIKEGGTHIQDGNHDLWVGYITVEGGLLHHSHRPLDGHPVLGKIALTCNTKVSSPNRLKCAYLGLRYQLAEGLLHLLKRQTTIKSSLNLLFNQKSVS